jgi:hypothetical protein
MILQMLRGTEQYGLRARTVFQALQAPFLHPLTVLNGRILRPRYFLVGVPQSHGTAAYGSLEAMEQMCLRILMMVLTGLRRLLEMRCLQLAVTQSLGMARNGSLEVKEQISWRIRLMG